jgi:hypothetical protein
MRYNKNDKQQNYSDCCECITYELFPLDAFLARLRLSGSSLGNLVEDLRRRGRRKDGWILRRSIVLASIKRSEDRGSGSFVGDYGDCRDAFDGRSIECSGSGVVLSVIGVDVHLVVVVISVDSSLLETMWKQQ